MNSGTRDPQTGHDEDAAQPQAWSSRSYWVALGLFIATAGSTWYAGHTYYGSGWLYMLPVMSILLAHEMGHFLTSMYYRLPASPPFFLPMPFTPLGTLGALIVKDGDGREDRKMLFDIAIAGPLAGLVIAIPVCIYGAKTAVAVPQEVALSSDFLFNPPPILTWIVRSVRGDWPAGQVLSSPILDAGWVGIFITGLNLIPIGQLDGGHILYTLIRRWAHTMATFLVIFALVYMVTSGNPTFLPMLLLIFLMGTHHPPTANDSARLGWFRIVLGWVTLSFIFVGLTPTPIVMP